MARTVLLADDSVTAQNMGRRILTDAGYEVITVNNGSAALKKIHESRPDLIVLDVYMPGYGGLEVCQRIKESEATMKIPVLLTVGKMEPFKTEEAKRVRADGHIIKPFDASELLAALTRMEDRIVPQSENGRGRQTKAEPRKPTRRFKVDEIAAEEDESRRDQISYLEQTKKRNATSSNSEPATQIQADEVAEEAVTFASGPIYKPETWNKAAASAPEFPIEKPAAVEPPAEIVREVAVANERHEQEIKSEPGLVPDNRSESPYIAEAAAAEGAPKAEPEVVYEDSRIPEPPKSESAPHWIAENVALTAEEASRSLDEEMRQAQVEPEATSEQKIAEPAPAVEAQSEAVVEAHPEEAAPQVEVEHAAVEEQTEEANPETDSSGAAFAAAASASSSSIDAVSTEAAPSAPEPAPGGEAAAAWENWQRIRDSVINKHVADALTESMAGAEQTPTAPEAESRNEPQSSEAAPAPPEALSSQSAADVAPQPAAGGDALSSIVDSVLAELKPRLLAEIAKQLSSDKK